MWTFQIFEKKSRTGFGTLLDMSPPRLCISLMNLEEIKWYFSDDIKKIVSISLSIDLFIPVIKNSYSKSETALKPRIITEAFLALT